MTPVGKLHDLKTWPDHFQAVWDGRKRFEFRLNDRGFAVGDVLVLREYDLGTNAYSRRRIHAGVTHVFAGEAAEAMGLAPGYCIMSLEILARCPARNSGF